MRVSHAIYSALLGTVALATPAKPRADDAAPVDSTIDSKTTAEERNDFVPGAYIVELDDHEDSASFYRALADEDGVEVEHRMDLNSRLFKGASFQVRDAAAGSHEEQAQFLAQVKTKPRVKNAWPVRIVKLKEPKLANGGQASVPFTPSAATAAALRKRQGEEGKDTTDTFSPHVATQVDRLHAEGITGKGIRIAIVDSGVDYKHPALGGCFGPGCLVEAGHDFTGDDFLPPGNPSPDDDPYDDCVGHGTHVAGIIAAQLEGNDFGFTGAAPGVKLAAYRAWGCRATSTTEILIAAFNMAFEDGADIISCSDGDVSGWSDDAWALVSSRIVKAGVPVVVSEGNDGGAGLFYASTPATGRGVTGVGASTNTHYPVLFTAATYAVGDDNTTSDEFGFLQGYPQYTSEVRLPLWPVGNDTTSTSDACAPLSDDTPDLSDRIVLLRVPENKNCYPYDQGTNVAAKGGRYLMYYAQDNLTIDEQYVYADGIQSVAMVAPYQGALWIDLLNQGETVTVSMPNPNKTSTRLEELENNISGGYIADLTSWGPTWELAATPQLVAPGAHILSTYLLNQGGYRVMTGTSMSCPLVAAIYALIAEARGTIDPELFRSLLSGTSKPQVWFDRQEASDDAIAPVPQQGAGVVQAYDAAHASAVLSVDSISFNDSDHFVGQHTFSVRNTGAEELTFKLGHTKAVTMYTFLPGADVLRAVAFPNPIVEGSAELAFSSGTIVVPAGGSADIAVSGAPPTGLNATLLPVYSGYITLTSSNSNSNAAATTTLRLPYLGVAGSLKSTPLLQHPARVYLADYNLPAEANRTYTLPRPDPAATPPRDDQHAQPNVLVGLTVGTRTLRVDVVALQGGNSSSNSSSDGTGLPTTRIRGVETVGSLPGFPLSFVPRDEKRAYFKGLLDDGTVLPAGPYKLLVSALRVFGGADKDEDWDVVETVPFNVEYE